MSVTQKTKASDGALERWSLKDVLVAIPFLSSTLALIWEVGYFARMGGSAFGFFSLAEHLTFAIQALPFALVFTTSIMLVIALRIALGASSLRVQRIFRISAYIVGVIAVVALVALFHRASEFFTLMLALLLIAPLFFADAPTNNFKATPVVILGILWLSLVAMLSGVVISQFQMRSTGPLSILQIQEKGKQAETGIKVRIMRTGDRGVLCFDPAVQNFGIIPWESVKRIDWADEPF